MFSWLKNVIQLDFGIDFWRLPQTSIAAFARVVLSYIVQSRRHSNMSGNVKSPRYSVTLLCQLCSVRELTVPSTFYILWSLVC